MSTVARLHSFLKIASLPLPPDDLMHFVKESLTYKGAAFNLLCLTIMKRDHFMTLQLHKLKLRANKEMLI